MVYHFCSAASFGVCEVLEGGAGSHAGESGIDVAGSVGGCTVANPSQLGTMSARGLLAHCLLRRQLGQYHSGMFFADILLNCGR